MGHAIARQAQALTVATGRDGLHPQRPLRRWRSDGVGDGVRGTSTARACAQLGFIDKVDDKKWTATGLRAAEARLPWKVVKLTRRPASSLLPTDAHHIRVQHGFRDDEMAIPVYSRGRGDRLGELPWGFLCRCFTCTGGS